MSGWYSRCGNGHVRFRLCVSEYFFDNSRMSNTRRAKSVNLYYTCTNTNAKRMLCIVYACMLYLQQQKSSQQSKKMNELIYSIVDHIVVELYWVCSSVGSSAIWEIHNFETTPRRHNTLNTRSSVYSSLFVRPPCSPYTYNIFIHPSLVVASRYQ